MNKFEGIKLVHLESSDYVGEALRPTVEREIDTADIVIDGGKVVKNRVNQAEQRKLIKDNMGVYDAHLGESAKNEMHSRRLKMLQVMPVLDKRISETLEENGIPGFYSLDAVRLLLAVYKATNSVMPGHYEDADSDF